MLLRPLLWSVLANSLSSRMMNLALIENLDDWQEFVQFLRVAFDPGSAPSLLPKVDELLKIVLLLFKLGQEVRCGTEMMATVAGGDLGRAISLFRLEAIAIWQTNSIQIVANVLPFNFVFV